MKKEKKTDPLLTDIPTLKHGQRHKNYQYLHFRFYPDSQLSTEKNAIKSIEKKINIPFIYKTERIRALPCGKWYGTCYCGRSYSSLQYVDELEFLKTKQLNYNSLVSEFNNYIDVKIDSLGIWHYWEVRIVFSALERERERVKTYLTM